MVDVQPKTSHQNQYSKYHRMALCVWFPGSIRHVDTGQTSSSVSQRRITSLSWQSYDLNFFGLEHTTHRYIPSTHINSLKWTTTTPTSNFKKWSCLPSQWFLLLSERPSASFKYRMPSEPTSSCPSSAMRDHKMSRYCHDHKVPVSQHELAMTFDRSMWRMKRNMHFKGEFPLPNFHPGNLPVMLGVENPTGRMVAIAWPYSWRLTRFLMQSCVSSFWLIQPCQFVNLALSSHDSSWLNQFWLNALMFTNQFMFYEYAKHTYSCLQISNMIYVHINILNIKPCMSNLPLEIPPPLKPWSVGQVSSSNWSWHWINLKPGHR